MINLELVSFHYPNQPAIFKDFSWQVKTGEIWSVLGPSGCGKSTLLYLLAGLRLPVNGKILINHQVLNQPRPSTGLILQDYGLLPWATVRENIRLGLRIRSFYGPDGIHAPTEGPDENTLSSTVDYWIDHLGLSNVANQFPARISGGQRQRTAIARTLVLSPDVLLMDEPFASLDAPTREDLQRLILKLHEEKQLTILTVTHSIEEAAFLGKKILVLKNPPISSAAIIENDHAGDSQFTHSNGYLEICSQLRMALES